MPMNCNFCSPVITTLEQPLVANVFFFVCVCVRTCFASPHDHSAISAEIRSE